MLKDFLLDLLSKNSKKNLEVNPENENKKENKVAISIEAYFKDSKSGKDRREEFPEDYSPKILENAKVLLEKVNSFLQDLGILMCIVNSGWRPPSVNSAVGGSKNSAHCTGEAIDIKDSTGSLKEKVLNNLELLEKHGLYMESPNYTKTWCHLQTRPTKSGKRVFNP